VIDGHAAMGGASIARRGVQVARVKLYEQSENADEISRAYFVFNGHAH